MKHQIPASIYIHRLGVMKSILDLGAYRLGKKTDEYKFYKREVMNYIYDDFLSLMKEFEKCGLVKKCSCGANVRHGYKADCVCRGSG